MKKILWMVWIVLLCLQAGTCFAENAEEEGTAVLTFSSFDGGGPEFSIEIDDPELVSYVCRKKYDHDDHEMMTGSSYNEIYTFTGLKSGTTQMTVSAYSPLMESMDSQYTIIVDENLHVTINPIREISRFHVYRYGEIAFDSFEIIAFDDGYSMSINGKAYRAIDTAVVDKLACVIEDYDLFGWDGFDESRDDVLDGEGFVLEVEFTDGTSIRAQGDNAFPENYSQAMGEIWDILENIHMTPEILFETLFDLFSKVLPG